MSNTKIIRLHSDRIDGEFDCNFNENININPYSKIAFKNCNINRAHDVLAIDNFKNILRFQLTNANEKEVVVPTGLFHQNKIIEELLTPLSDNMNDKLLIDNPREIGTQVNISINNNARTVFSIEQSKNERADLASSALNNNFTYRGIKNTSTKLRTAGNVGTPDDLNEAIIFGKVPMCMGAAYFRYRIRNITDNAEGGCIIGLVDKQTYESKVLEKDLVETDFTYAIKCMPQPDSDNPSIAYQVKLNKNANFTNASRAPGVPLLPHKIKEATLQQNDIIGIEFTEGTALLVIRQDTDAVPNIHSFNVGVKFDRNKEFYPVLVFLGEETQMIIDMLSYQPNPYFNREITSESEDNLGDTPHPQQNRLKSIHNIILPSIEFANFFGYTALDQNPLDITTANANYVGTKNISGLVSNHTYIVQLLSHNLEVYDSKIGGKKSILIDIPIKETGIDNQTSILRYEPPNYSFISLNNQQPLSIRNIRLLITDGEFNRIITEGQSSITLLIEEPHLN